MSLSISINKSISEIDVSWDNLLPSNHHLKSCHLLAFENSNLEDIETYYVKIFLKGKFIGVVYLQQFSIQHQHFQFTKYQKLLSNILKIILLRKLPVLVCGNIFRIDFQGFYFKDILHKNYIFDAIKLFAKQSSNCKAKAIVIKDCQEVFAIQNINYSGFQYFDGDVTMEIFRRNNWLAFEDYLNDLTKKYQQRAKKIIKAFDGLQKIELSAIQILDNADIINKLYNNVVEKQSVKLCTVNANYFVQLKQDLKNNFEFHAIYKNEIIIGFYTLIFYQNQMETHFIGLDYKANKEHQIYFNILFLGVEKMIALQMRRLELGRTARDAKENLGAKPKQIINYVFINNFLFRFALKYFLKVFNDDESNNIVHRNPLK